MEIYIHTKCMKCRGRYRGSIIQCHRFEGSLEGILFYFWQRCFNYNKVIKKIVIQTGMIDALEKFHARNVTFNL